MSIFNGLQINASGLALERLKLDTTSTNIANVNTTRTPEGGPYRRKSVQFAENLRQVEADNGNIMEANKRQSSGVRVTGIAQDQTEKLSYKPDDPDADQNGYVHLPNVNLADEMIDLIQSQRSYEANVASSQVNKQILSKALEISEN
ncbi:MULTISPECIES: flagellar basal body rod protein FlgC [Lactobacillaceae]|uniref:Flagellar basal-body rod protein FlgC n=2 Tax=Lactobacillaceae TaxID=33958 RepID=A0A0B2XBQ1_LATCU|nr:MULTISPECIES: flagellar basal body rod protein FlgC [Lactobacillaceae]AJA33955.1 flagellar basal-body rod protein FlgC [Latilactobacillus curvatus]ANY12595.1 flagellar basal body rod protein FlgC [Latilactobacillus curvatus]KHO12338.1 flagellar basal-body rod protein FlgC [Latilactobacillus curvatus]MCM0725381.1 flagellar basal body rod protein FlgC [Latilactobacillus curvatus]MCP8847323.1 flagellar basal body rod protein FlgC [Latilactobacillus curvatus]